MVCQTCEVNAAQFHLMKYEDTDSNNVITEWFLCEEDLDNLAATIPAEDAGLYFVEKLWS